MKLLLAISASAVTFSVVYYLAAIVTGLMFAHRSMSAPRPLPKIPPRVAILKPLRGVSEHLRENVISFLEIAYSRVEYIFGVTSYEDRAIDVPVSLRAPYQFANMTVVVGEEPGSSNRKIAKLIRMAERASDKTDIFVLSDADISVEPDHLQRVVSELTADPKIGIVTCIYRGQAYESFASRMEALFINTDFAPQVILAEALEPMKYALGATIAVKREALEAIGGFRALENLLADDFHLGSKVAEAGYNIELSSSIVTVACEDHNFTDFWNHQLRWARTYRHVRPLSHHRDPRPVLGNDVHHRQSLRAALLRSARAGARPADADGVGDDWPRPQASAIARRCAADPVQGSRDDRDLLCEPYRENRHLGRATFPSVGRRRDARTRLIDFLPIS